MEHCIILAYSSEFGTADIAVVGEVSLANHSLFLLLMAELAKLKTINHPLSKVLIRKIAAILPRLDTGTTGIPIEGLSDRYLEELFIGSESVLAKLHRSRNPAKEYNLARDGAPVPPSGEPIADMLANLSTSLNSVRDALALTDRLSMNAVIAFSRTFSELHRDPEQRIHEHRAKAYKEQIADNPEKAHINLGM